MTGRDEWLPGDGVRCIKRGRKEILQRGLRKIWRGVKDSFSLGLTVLDVSQAYTCVEIVKVYTLNSTFVHLSMYKLYTLNMFP